MARLRLLRVNSLYGMLHPVRVPIIKSIATYYPATSLRSCDVYRTWLIPAQSLSGSTVNYETSRLWNLITNECERSRGISMESF